jgi:hypothetical protein
MVYKSLLTNVFTSFCLILNKICGRKLKMNTALEYSTRVVQEGGRLMYCLSSNTFNEPATPVQEIAASCTP